jgi:predicted metalloprotease with PDZ domain
MIHLLLSALLAAPPPPPRYELIYSRETPREVRVEAELTLHDTLLVMVPYGAEHLPDGWRTFVRGEALRTLQGTPVPLTRVADRRWRVGGHAGERVRLSYTIAIEHDLQPWTPNAREAAYARPWGVFAVGRALFIYGDPEERNIHLRVRAPAGWTASTAWDPAPDDPGSYVAPTWDDALNSLVFVGQAERFSVTEGPITVSYVLGGSGFAPAAALLRRVTGEILRSYLELFQAAPDARLLVVINPDSSAHGGGGGVFRRSISMTFNEPPSERTIVGWGHTLAHELFHVWNSTGLRQGSDAEEWLKEGFADYYAVLTMTRLGYFPGSVWSFKASQWIGGYERVAGTWSLAEAGAHEWEGAGPELLYSGGATAALALDAALREARPNGSGLDGVMRALYRALGNTGTPVTNARVAEEVRAAGYADAAAFFARHVTGRERIPVGPALARLGMERAGAGVRLAAAPDAAQTAWRLRYFGAKSRLDAPATGSAAGPALVSVYAFEAGFSGTPVAFEIQVTRRGLDVAAVLRAPQGELPSATAKVEGNVTTLEFDVHGAVLRVELRPAADGRFTGSWWRGGEFGDIEGSVHTTHT